MTALLTATSPAVLGDATTIDWLSPDGAEERCGLTEVWSVHFEDGLPVRRFRGPEGQRRLSGLWWSATTGAHVSFESWLEFDHVVALAFDRTVVGLASQLFWLHWLDGEGRLPAITPER